MFLFGVGEWVKVLGVFQETLSGSRSFLCQLFRTQRLSSSVCHEDRLVKENVKCSNSPQIYFYLQDKLVRDCDLMLSLGNLTL